MRIYKAWLGACAVGAFLTLGTGCSINELLEVDNPEEIQLDALDDPALLDVRLAGVVGTFQEAYVSPNIEYANFLTDEVVTGLNWEDYARANQRIASYLEGPTNAIFEEFSQSLRMAHNLAEDIERWQAADPDADFQEELATALAIAGYSAVMLGETMCQVVISPDPDNPSGELLTPVQTFGVAVPYLTEALSVAEAANEEAIANLARLGLARAHLNMANWAEAANFASQVEAGFEWWINFVDLSGGRNPLQGTSHGGNFTHGINPLFTGVHPSFAGAFEFGDDGIVAPQTDPRIQHLPTDRKGHNALTPLYKLIQGLRYSGYVGETIAPASASCPDCTGTDPDDMPLLTEYDTDVLLGDELEARHHYFEALSMQDIAANEAAILAFVNERRAVGNQAPIAASGQALRDALREQRARDLFMGGFRLGDLRRWTRFDAGNGPFANGSYFPTGTHPVSQWGQYGEWTCFPIPIAEYEGNPNLAKPANPNEPPGI